MSPENKMEISDSSEKKYSILIADDNQNNLKVLSTMLESLGYRVRVATSGELTIRSVKSMPPDLLLLDIHMPGMDGYEVCRILKSSEEYNDIPIIFLSALSEVFNKIEAFKAGGVDYITKPFEFEEVSIRIENHLRLKEKTIRLQKAIEDLKNKEGMIIQSEKMAALGLLTSGIAHEINNPVNFIANSVTALEDRINIIVSENRPPDKEMTGDFEELFTNISAGLTQITKIVHSLRLYSRNGNDKIEDANLIEIINSAITIMHHRISYRISLVQNISPIPPIRCQPGKLSQVIINLLSNSTDAIEEAITAGMIKDGTGSITLAADANYGQVKISITDNGVGIDSSIHKKLFDPFFTTKPVGRGTGLGLSICQSIISDHNGSISIDSTPGKGTSVLITLPLTGV
jgi:signal transduction histidine kinase